MPRGIGNITRSRSSIFDLSPTASEEPVPTAHLQPLAMRVDDACFAAHTAFRGLCLRRTGLLTSPRTTRPLPVLRRRRWLATSAPPAGADGAPGYDFRTIERKWRDIWSTRGDFKTPDIDKLDRTKPKFYALDMFPYPSGSGLHVGHPEGYTATDIVARTRRKQGYNVLHPMGWDAFGLPAEQYALQTGAHPAATTAANVARFRGQLQSLGFCYDWSREVATTDPGYYRWTQWIFLKLWERGLAYQDFVPVNWCPALSTVLANEEVIDGVSERGGHPVERRPMRQWVLRITEYADRLLEDLEGLDWPESIKDMQRNWIGRSVGAELQFEVEATGRKVGVYTTRPETVCGVAYLVVAPEWEGVKEIASEGQRDVVAEYVDAALRKSDRERTGEGAARAKTGVFTGAYGINPVNGERVQIWVADYVLGSYGTGAVMAVPAHDARDFEFATAYSLPIKTVIAGGQDGEPFLEDGVVINWPVESGIDLNGVRASEAKEMLMTYLEKTGLGQKKVNYKLRDWLFSRQRYWGEPFPIIFVNGKAKAVSEDELPVMLPEVESYHPSGTGDSPLANVTDWVNTVDKESGMAAVRETNTMPQWAGSCWYYLRFIDPKNVGQAVDPELEKYWMPVDLYIGGVEHAVLHLLYARFWHKVLYDVGVVSTKEPFQKLVNQGMILGEVEYSAYKNAQGQFISVDDVDIATCTILSTGESVESCELLPKEVEKRGDGMFLKSNPEIRVSARAQKMSKSRGNVVNPDTIVEAYGADSLRCYLMFMGPLEQVKPWGTKGVQGMSRFLSRAWRLIIDPQIDALNPSLHDNAATAEQRKTLHQMIKKVTDETESLRFNTAIAGMMEFVNAVTKWEDRPREVVEPFVSILGVYAPHVAEELWLRLGHRTPLAHAPWPEYRAEYVTEEKRTIVVQVNGKVRSRLQVPCGMEREDIVQRALEQDGVQRHLKGMTVRKQIYVPDKLVNLVVSK